MTVKDLIERLKVFDPESLVVTCELDEEGVTGLNDYGSKYTR